MASMARLPGPDRHSRGQRGDSSQKSRLHSLPFPIFRRQDGLSEQGHLLGSGLPSGCMAIFPVEPSSPSGYLDLYAKKPDERLLLVT